MKKLFLLLSGIPLLLIVTGCTSIKRFKSATYKSEDNSLVDMDLFGSRLVTDRQELFSRNLWDLSAGAQTQLIQILNERYPDNGQFISQLSKEYLTNENVGLPDFTSKSLRMVFTISKLRDYKVINDGSARFSPADRIEYLKFYLEIPELYNLQFKEWNRYTTEYGEIEIADVSFSKSFDLNLDGSLTQESDARGKGVISRTEEQEVRSRYLKLNGSINNLKIEVEEEGTRDIDLTGNVIADVSLEFEGFPERLTIPQFVGGIEGSIVAAVRFVDVLVPRMKDAPDLIKAVLQLEYIYRHVQTGWKTYQEWDDQVEYYSGTVKKEVILFTKKDFLPSFYCIGTENDGKTAMKVRTGNGVEYLLQFKDYSDAEQFLEWLKGLEKDGGNGSDIPVRLGQNTFYFNGNPVTPGHLEEIGLKVLPVY